MKEYLKKMQGKMDRTQPYIPPPPTPPFKPRRLMALVGGVLALMILAVFGAFCLVLTIAGLRMAWQLSSLVMGLVQ